MTGIRKAAMVLFAVMSMSGFLQSVQAEDAPADTGDLTITCASFANDQAAAQAYFEANQYPGELDWNGNGIACEGEGDGDFTSLPTADQDTNGPSAWPEWTCATFPGTTEDASAYFDEFGGPASLDVDGDGIACNEGTDAEGPSAWPEWTCDTFPDGIDAAVNYFDTYGGPATLDADGDGTACNEGAGAQDEDSDSADTDADDSSTTEAAPLQLPNTGAGSPASSSLPLDLLMGGALMALAATGMVMRQARQTR